MMTNFRMLACCVLLCGLMGLAWHATGQETPAPETTLSPEALKWVSEGKDLAAKGELDGTVSAFNKAFAAAQSDDDTSQIAVACFLTAKSLFEKENAASAADQLVEQQHEVVPRRHRIKLALARAANPEPVGQLLEAQRPRE